MYLPEANETMPEKKPCVMVVSEDEAVRDSLAFTLRLEGAEVCVHATGAGMLADHRLAGAACLVLRYHLPDTEGLEILRAVRARGLTMPAIMLTSHATPMVKARAQAAGVWLLLEKPIMDEALTGAVAGLLREIT